MSMSSDGLGKFVRAAVVSGLLGAAGLVAVASPAHAQDNGSDNGSDAGADNGSDAGNGSDNGSDAGATTTGGTTTGGTAEATTGDLPVTGANAGATLALGGAAAGIALGARRLLAARA